MQAERDLLQKLLFLQDKIQSKVRDFASKIRTQNISIEGNKAISSYPALSKRELQDYIKFHTATILMTKCDEVSSFSEAGSCYFKNIPDGLTSLSENRIKFVETLKAQTFLSLK